MSFLEWILDRRFDDYQEEHLAQKKHVEDTEPVDEEITIAPPAAPAEGEPKKKRNRTARKFHIETGAVSVILDEPTVGQLALALRSAMAKPDSRIVGAFFGEGGTLRLEIE